MYSNNIKNITTEYKLQFHPKDEEKDGKERWGWRVKDEMNSWMEDDDEHGIYVFKRF